MSYDIALHCACCDQRLHFDEPHDLRGGTYEVGGTREARLNVTYNYAPHSYRTMGEKGIRELYGKRAIDTVPLLEKAISELKTDVNDDYWEPTEGNARRALENLLTMAKAKPLGVWDGD